MGRGRSTAASRLILSLLVLGTFAVADLSLFRWNEPQGVSAQSPGFTIIVYDYTSRWDNRIKTGVQRWDAALATRGIRLTYSRQSSTWCEALSQPTYGVSVCDNAATHPSGYVADGEHQGIWATEDGIQVQGRVRFYRAAPASSYADNLVCHELGHTLQLLHVPSGTDSCMTQFPARSTPSASDIANAFSYIPTLVAGNDHRNLKNDKKGKKGKAGKKHGKQHGKKHRH